VPSEHVNVATRHKKTFTGQKTLRFCLALSGSLFVGPFFVGLLFGQTCLNPPLQLISEQWGQQTATSYYKHTTHRTHDCRHLWFS